MRMSAPHVSKSNGFSSAVLHHERMKNRASSAGHSTINKKCRRCALHPLLLNDNLLISSAGHSTINKKCRRGALHPLLLKDNLLISSVGHSHSRCRCSCCNSNMYQLFVSSPIDDRILKPQLVRTDEVQTINSSGLVHRLPIWNRNLRRMCSLTWSQKVGFHYFIFSKDHNIIRTERSIVSTVRRTLTWIVGECAFSAYFVRSVLHVFVRSA